MEEKNDFQKGRDARLSDIVHLIRSMRTHKGDHKGLLELAHMLEAEVAATGLYIPAVDMTGMERKQEANVGNP